MKSSNTKNRTVIILLLISNVLCLLYTYRQYNYYKNAADNYVIINEGDIYHHHVRTVFYNDIASLFLYKKITKEDLMRLYMYEGKELIQVYDSNDSIYYAIENYSDYDNSVYYDEVLVPNSHAYYFLFCNDTIVDIIDEGSNRDNLLLYLNRICNK